MKKTLILSSIAASALALATLSYAATGTAPADPSPAVQAASKINMAAALDAAKAKFPDANALSASLHGTRGYGLVWDVRMEGEDGSVARVFVSPEDGSVLASDHCGIREGAPRYERGPGMGMNPDCPYYGEGRPHHRGGWHHDGRRGGNCPWF